MYQDSWSMKHEYMKQKHLPGINEVCLSTLDTSKFTLMTLIATLCHLEETDANQR